jgi:putative transposase
VVLWPGKDGEVTAFRRWLTLAHGQRLHAHRHTTGYGHIYQGRFKSFPIEQDQSLLNVLRYVERNALRANLVGQAQEWPRGSLSRNLDGDRESLLSAWPLDRPKNWVNCANGVQTEAEIESLRKCVNRDTPYGSEAWTTRIANALGLESSLHPRGRPKKALA